MSMMLGPEGIVQCPHDRALCHHFCPISMATAPGEYNCYRKQNGMNMTQGLGDESSLRVELLDEKVEHPAHYGGDSTYEVIKVCEAWDLDEDAYLFMVVKYVARAGKKPGESKLDDLKKAKVYLERRIFWLEEEEKS